MHASIIICYNPSLNQINNLCRLIGSESSKIILVDNSDIAINKEDLDLQSNIKLISNEINLGIARAQNIGIMEAIESKVEYLTFFDQDSIIQKGFIKRMISLMRQADAKVSAPLVIDNQTNEHLPALRLNRFGLPYKLKLGDKNKVEIADIVISSGTTVRADILKKVGMFDESLFIDHVDTDWCLKCRDRGVNINIFSEIRMLHSIGSHRIKFGPFTIQIHKPERCYYQIRNSIHLIRKKHIPFLFALREILLSIFNRFILLFFVNGKIKYIKYFIKGLMDGIFKRMEPLP